MLSDKETRTVPENPSPWRGGEKFGSSSSESQFGSLIWGARH